MKRWIGPILVTLVGVVMLFIVWGRGPDPVLDFGRELYIPWRINAGEVLYQDIVYFNGPFSPYLNALVFKIAGTSLLVLTTFNLLLVIGLTSLIYWLVLKTADAVGATVASISFLVFCALAHRTGIANFNFLTPYSHELPHGIGMSLAMIACDFAYFQKRRTIWLAAAGLLLGLIFLTKAEVFLAAAITQMTALMFHVWLRRESTMESLLDAGAFAVALILPIAIGFLLLAYAAGPRIALHGLAGSWPWVGDPRLMQLPYFRSMLGTLDVKQSLFTFARWSVVWALIIGVPWGFAQYWRSQATRISVIAAIVFGALVIQYAPKISWENWLRPMPLLLAAILAIHIATLIRRRRLDADHGAPVVLAIVLTIFAGVMLAKMALNVSLLHYGFALAMPSVIVLSVGLTNWLPRWMERRGAPGAPMRNISLALLAAALFVHARITWRQCQDKIVPVGSGADSFMADGRGMAVDYLLEALQSVPSNKTLTCVPEGLIINYLGRRVNPSPFHQLTPPNLIMYGEEPMLASLQIQPPDFVAMVHIENVEYGARFFGRHYARDIARWIEANYHEVQLFGQMPFQQSPDNSPRFGIRLMQRND